MLIIHTNMSQSKMLPYSLNPKLLIVRQKHNAAA
jgi:hypothetical protein